MHISVLLSGWVSENQLIVISHHVVGLLPWNKMCYFELFATFSMLFSLLSYYFHFFRIIFTFFRIIFTFFVLFSLFIVLFSLFLVLFSLLSYYFHFFPYYFHFCRIIFTFILTIPINVDLGRSKAKPERKSCDEARFVNLRRLHFI